MIQSVYNNLVSTYTKNPVSKYSVHKTSELRSVYNHIINLNKQSPLYMFRLSNENQLFAIGIKEASINLNEAVSCISNNRDSLFNQKIAESSDNTIVEVHNITTNNNDNNQEYQIRVLNTATKQVNTSNEVPSNGQGLKPGPYVFTINTKNHLYEYQINVSTNSTNIELQTKLMNFINQSNIGLHASIEEGSTPDSIKLILKSETTGTDSDLIFSLKDCLNDNNTNGIVQYYGLNNVTSYPQNAKFTLNGELIESVNNSFSLDETMNLTLKSASSNTVSIHYVPDSDKILHNIDKMVNAYNNLISIANRSKEEHKRASKLISDIGLITNLYKNELESCGLNINRDNYLIIDRSLALSSINDGDMQKLFSHPSRYSSKLIHKTYDIMINPMDYIDKVVVSYKNTSKPCYPSQYITSIYSGMLFNYYC